MLGHVALFGRFGLYGSKITLYGRCCGSPDACRCMLARLATGGLHGWVEHDSWARPARRRALVSVAGQLKAGQLLPGGRQRGRLVAVLFIGLPTLGRSGLLRSCTGTKAALERLAPFLNHCFLRLRPCLSGLAAAPVPALGAPVPVAFASGLRALALISRQVSHPT
jgi:hypothetical protein